MFIGNIMPACMALQDAKTRWQPSFLSATAVKAWLECKFTSLRVKFSSVWRLLDAQREEKKFFSPLTLRMSDANVEGLVLLTKIKSWNHNLKISGSRYCMFIYVKWRPCTGFFFSVLNCRKNLGKVTLWFKFFTGSWPEGGLYVASPYCVM